MMVHIPRVLSPEQVAECRQLLQQASWVDGKATAGFQSAMAKDNLQLPQDSPAGPGHGRDDPRGVVAAPVVYLGSVAAQGVSAVVQLLPGRSVVRPARG